MTYARTRDSMLRAFVQQLLLLKQWRKLLFLKPRWHPKHLSPEYSEDLSQSISGFQRSRFLLKLRSLPGFGHFERNLLPAPVLQPPSHPHFGWRWRPSSRIYSISKIKAGLSVAAFEILNLLAFHQAPRDFMGLPSA